MNSVIYKASLPCIIWIKMSNKQTIEEIEKLKAVIDKMKEEKQKLVCEAILNHSVILGVDMAIWNENEKLLALYDSLLEVN